MELKELKKIIKKNEKSEYQNCFKCEWFPKNNKLEASIKAIGIFKIDRHISAFFWSMRNIEVIAFRCNYLRKRVSEAIKPWRTNSCLCFRPKEVN